jgi:hypothetical protein
LLGDVALVLSIDGIKALSAHPTNIVISDRVKERYPLLAAEGVPVVEDVHVVENAARVDVFQAHGTQELLGVFIPKGEPSGSSKGETGTTTTKPKPRAYSCFFLASSQRSSSAMMSITRGKTSKATLAFKNARRVRRASTSWREG